MRWLSLLLVIACRSDRAPSPAEITDRVWTAHAAVVAAGEQAASCAAAGPAMQAALTAHRQAFTDALALDRDTAQLAQATAWIEANEARYQDLETRSDALAERCATDAAVQAVFAQMTNP